MRIKYEGGHPVLLMYEGQVWKFDPGDELDLPFVPEYPGFKAVKVAGPDDKASTKKGE